MKYKLPRVNAIKLPMCWQLVRLFSAAFLVIPMLAFAQEPPANTEPSGQIGGQASGQEIVAQAAAQMTQHPSLEAKMRQRVGIREQYMVGSGAYLQLRHGADTRFRLELRLQVGERLTSLQHITDNRYLYIRRDIGETKSVSRIDLKRVQEAQARNDAGNAPLNYASLGIELFD